MKHVLAGKIYERTIVRDSKGKAVRVEKIGVALFAQTGVRTRGYRVARSLSELQKIVGAESPR
jgi:hypothetical protein